jgi:hypothetical protein
MKQPIGIVAVSFLWILSAGCTAGSSMPSAGTGVMEVTETGPTNTKTPKPTATITPTPSDIPTVVPMVTQSPGPAPDVEIFNVSFSKTVNNIAAFFGEIRNNTDQPMIFTGRLVALRFGIEEWWTDEYILFAHRKYDVLVTPRPDENLVNCILYPSETGIIAFDFNICSSKDNCEGKWEDLSSPPPQLGRQLLDYETYPKRWEEFLQFRYIQADYPSAFDPNFHLKVENVSSESQIIDEQADWGAMFFDFDIDFYYAEYQSSAHLPVWIIMYDKDDRIINVALNNWIDLCEGYGCAESGQIYHISGAVCNQKQCLWEDWGATKPPLQWFKPIAKLTVDEINQVDHVRILAENQDNGICINTDFTKR